MVDKKDFCPCYSGKCYKNCCYFYHKGQLPPDALALMRSRYAAYALGIADYIISTTHRENPAFTENTLLWKKQIESFSKETKFEGLDILEFTENGNEAFVLFVARLKQGDQDTSFQEKSRFKKEKRKWFYETSIEITKTT